MTSIELRSLPCVRLCDLELLPEFPGVYFVVSGENVLYIGKAEASIRSRWRQHHRKSQLVEFKDAVIYCKEARCSKQELKALEDAAILKFRPSLNQNRIPAKHKQIASASSKLKRFSIRLPKFHYKELSLWSTCRGQSVSGLAERELMEWIEANEEQIERIIADEAEETGRSVDEVKKQWLSDANYDPSVFNSDRVNPEE